MLGDIKDLLGLFLLVVLFSGWYMHLVTFFKSPVCKGCVPKYLQINWNLLSNISGKKKES